MSFPVCLVSLGMTISLKVETGFAILSAGTPHYYKGPQLLWWWSVRREEASVTPLLGFILWRNLCSQAVTCTHVPHFSVFNTLGDAGRLRGLELGVSLLLGQLVVGLVAQSCPTLQSHGLSLTRLLCPWDSPDKNTGVGLHALLPLIS